VGDRLRAYAQKFKEGKEKGGSKEKDNSVRSASAGRSDTIQEETFEDVEAEKTAGVIRAYSLNSKAVACKPSLQSHSSTESTDIPTPKSTPNRGKKKTLKGSEGDSEVKAVERQKKPFRGHKRAGPGRGSVMGVESEVSRGGCGPRSVCLGCDMSRGGCGECTTPGEVSPLDTPDQDFCFTFPEVFRQAIQEVDQLTQKLGEEEGRLSRGTSSEHGAGRGLPQPHRGHQLHHTLH
jgi:hypothetical protein